MFVYIKNIIIFVMLIIHIALFKEFINASEFEVFLPLRYELLALNEAGFYFNIMPKKINYISGQKINGITFIKEIRPYISPNEKKKCKALFQCPFCQNKFEAIIASIKSDNTKSCGCYNIKQLIKRSTTHGLYKHLLYKVWSNMIARCYNSNDFAYKNYGRRGITVCNEWLKDFKVFYDWCMTNDYKKDLTIDRKNNDGNYTPENCRFVNRHIQNTNKRVMSNNKSGFTGVSWNKNENKWKSYIRINNKQILLGSFKEKSDAVQSRNNYIIENNLTEYKIQ